MGRHPGEFLLTLSSDQDLTSKDVVLDHRLPPPTDKIAEEVKFVVSAALACTRYSPGSRPTMHSVAQELSRATQIYKTESFSVQLHESM